MNILIPVSATTTSPEFEQLWLSELGDLGSIPMEMYTCHRKNKTKTAPELQTKSNLRVWDVQDLEWHDVNLLHGMNPAWIFSIKAVYMCGGAYHLMTF